jgi:hypothetical protein
MQALIPFTLFWLAAATAVGAALARIIARKIKKRAFMAHPSLEPFKTFYALPSSVKGQTVVLPCRLLACGGREKFSLKLDPSYFRFWPKTTVSAVQ